MNPRHLSQRLRPAERHKVTAGCDGLPGQGRSRCRQRQCLAEWSTPVRKRQTTPGRDDEDKAKSVVRITNAPTLPAAPKYSGSTLKERRTFMRAYQTYVHALSAFDTAFGQPFVMPVSACVEERTRRMICLYELQKHPNTVTEAEWEAYFLQALEPELEDYTVLDKAMAQLKMQTSFPDTTSRMGRLRSTSAQKS